MLVYEMKTKPYSHQVDGLKYGIEHNKFLLGDEQGLGKTRSLIELACHNKINRGYKHCLIICGVNGLKWNWLSEIGIHSNEEAHILGTRPRKGKLKVGCNTEKLEDIMNIENMPYFIITNVESLRFKRKTGNKVRKKVGRHWEMVDEVEYPITDALVELCKNEQINMIAADEVHKMKNIDTEQGEQFLRLCAETEVAMTGTPLMNTPLDLYIILRWLGYEDHSYWQFKTHYCRLGGYGGHEVVGYKNLQQIQDLLDKMMLRRLKKDVLDLPEKIKKIEFVEMSSKQQRIYNEVYSDVLKNINKIISSPNALSQLIHLRQATGYTGILSSSVAESAKIDRLDELVEDVVANNEKVIIFSNWTSITDVVKDRLFQYNPLVITGDTKDEERQRIVDKFQNSAENKVIIGTIGAMGTGLTLTAANNVIFLDEPWNMALREQAEDRAHRIGQKQPVRITYLLTKNTIDERIHQLVEDKGDISDCVIDKKTIADNITFLLS